LTRPSKRGQRSARQADVEAHLVYKTGKNGEDVISAEPQSQDVPGAQDVLIRGATGSADSFGQPGGDHPLALFPETYVAPITVNPQDTSYDGINAAEWEATAATCLEGSLGCSCRQATSRVRCDTPLDCNAAGFCARPPCPKGEPGCACDAGSCSKAGFACNSQGLCAFKPACAEGDLGCTCKSGGVCTSSGSVCQDCTPDLDDEQLRNLSVAQSVQAKLFELNAKCLGVCTPGAGACVKGSKGCPCLPNGSCTESGFQCDTASGVCRAPTCLVGAPGCVCAEKGRCAANFACNEDKVCVQKECKLGDAGCLCEPAQGCNLPTHACRAMDINNREFRCVAKPRECGDNTQKCKLFCGEGRVLSCPSCSNQKILCRAKSDAATMTPLVILALLVALLF